MPSSVKCVRAVAAAAGTVAILAAWPIAASEMSRDANMPRVTGSRRAPLTLGGALAEAYQNNPQLNAQRAIVRSTDENVPQALSGYRPRITATADVGIQHTENILQSPITGRTRQVTNTHPRGVAATAT
jgi:outer membrane protein TolC